MSVGRIQARAEARTGSGKSGAPRRGRHAGADRTYILTTATRYREPLFRAFPLGRLVVDEIRSIHQDGLAASLAWVVMPEHLHWLLQLNPGTRLDHLMRRLKGRSALRINAALGRRGALWQDSLHDRALRQEADLHEAARHIVANPVRAGLVGHIGDYPLWDAAWL